MILKYLSVLVFSLLPWMQEAPAPVTWMILNRDTCPHISRLPAYPGGQLNMDRYIMRGLNNSKEKKLGGGQHYDIYASFGLSDEGKVGKVTITKNSDPSTDQKVIELLQAMPSWEPCLQSSKPASVRIGLHIKFDKVGLSFD